jgi:hypothetical protein
MTGYHDANIHSFFIWRSCPRSGMMPLLLDPKDVPLCVLAYSSPP